jgi:hypothetical protein
MSRTKSKASADLVDEVMNDLMPQLRDISQIVHLCAFAAEARRVLGDIDLAARVSPQLEASLDRFIESRAEWTTHDDNLGVVLRSAAWQIEEIHAQLDASSMKAST